MECQNTLASVKKQSVYCTLLGCPAIGCKLTEIKSSLVQELKKEEIPNRRTLTDDWSQEEFIIIGMDNADCPEDSTTFTET